MHESQEYHSMKFLNQNAARDHNRKGFSLLEIMVSLVILSIVVVSLTSVLKFISTTSIKSREQTLASNVSQKFFTRLNNIPYPYIFSCDSSSASFGLTGTFGPVTNQTGVYPYLSIFNELNNIIREYGFDRFTLDIRFVIRDLGDLDSDGETTDLRYYTDADVDGTDDYDIGLEYLDQNTDGDFRDTYSTPEITEEPHSRLKEVTLKIYKNNNEVFKNVQLVSWEKFTGVEGKTSGATLPIVITMPSENSFVYSLDNADQQDAFNLSISKSYASDLNVQRADSTVDLRITGQTTPNATLTWKLQSSTNPTLDTCSADFLGDFDCSVFNVTSSLIEGTNILYGQATKDVYYSPWKPTTFVREISTAIIRSQTFPNIIRDLHPTVRVVLVDEAVSPGRVVAGIDQSVISLHNGTTDLYHQYDPSSGYVTWIDSTTSEPPVLSTGSYTVVFEGGDGTMYKAKSTWTFTVEIDFTDHSAPSISNKDPSGFTFSNPPTISCKVFDNQSGIDMNSVTMSLDGDVVVSSSIGNLSGAYEPLAQQDGGTLSYTPPSALSGGSHNVTVTGSHWATNPTDKITSVDTWSFSVP